MKQVEKIFIIYIYEYLYKHRKLNTIKYMNQKMEFDDIFREIEISNYSQFNNIVDELKQKKTEEALKWCSKNRSKLKKVGSDFEFKLLYMQLLSLIKENKKKDEILEFIQQKVSSATEDLNKISLCIQLLLNY